MRSSLARELSSCCWLRADRSAKLAACWLKQAEATVGLDQGCSEVVAGPSEILLGQSDLISEQAGIPRGQQPGLLGAWKTWPRVGP